MLWWTERLLLRWSVAAASAPGHLFGRSAMGTDNDIQQQKVGADDSWARTYMGLRRPRNPRYDGTGPMWANPGWVATRAAGPATARPTVRWKPRPLAWPHDENTRKCVQRTCDLRASKLSTPAATAAASKQRLRAGMRCLQTRTYVQGISVAWKAWGGRLRRSGRDFANERREVSRQQVARTGMGKTAPRKNAICNWPRPHFVGSIARKTGLNEWKIGLAPKAWSGMWRLVRDTSSLHGPPSPRHRPHRPSQRHFAWVSWCRSRLVARTRGRKLWASRSNYLECIASGNICPLWHSYQMGCRWLTAGERVSGLPTAEAMAPRQTQATAGAGRDAETVSVSTGFCGYRTCRARPNSTRPGRSRFAHWP